MVRSYVGDMVSSREMMVRDDEKEVRGVRLESGVIENG